MNPGTAQLCSCNSQRAYADCCDLSVHYWQPKMFAIFFWAFSCGIPLLAVTATLSVRLAQAHLPLDKLSLFGLAILPYSLKFILCPLVARVRWPWLSQQLGRMRSWMLIMLFCSALGFFIISQCNVHSTRSLILLFITNGTVALCSALCDIAEAEYRLESLLPKELSIGSAFYTAGYGCGSIFASGFILVLSTQLGWTLSYQILSISMGVGFLAVMLGPAPANKEKIANPTYQNIWASWWEPLKALCKQHSWRLAFIVIMTYYLDYYVLLMVMDPFYLSLGFNAADIGTIQTKFGLPILLLGSLLGGIFAQKIGIRNALFYGKILTIFNILLYYLLWHSITYPTFSANNQFLLFVVCLMFTNILGSISVVPYISLIAQRCQAPFIASQNAFLTSLMAGSKVIFSSMGGYLVHLLGWSHLFILLMIAVIPVSICIYRLPDSPSKKLL